MTPKSPKPRRFAWKLPACCFVLLLLLSFAIYHALRYRERVKMTLQYNQEMAKTIQGMTETIQGMTETIQGMTETIQGMTETIIDLKNNETVFDKKMDFLEQMRVSDVDDAFLKIDPNEGLDYLQSHLARIFPDGVIDVSDEEKTFRVIRYITEYFRQQDNTGTATSILQDGYSVCGGMGRVCAALLRKLGLPTRSIGFFLPNGSHVAIEVYYDDAWHYFDTNYGIFFYTNSQYDGQGEIISFHTLLATDNYRATLTPYGLTNAIFSGNISYNVIIPFSLKWERSDPDASQPMTVHDESLELLQRSFWVFYGDLSKIINAAIEPQVAFSLPVMVDFQNTNRVLLGERDESFMDMADGVQNGNVSEKS